MVKLILDGPLMLIQIFYMSLNMISGLWLLLQELVDRVELRQAHVIMLLLLDGLMMALRGIGIQGPRLMEIPILLF